MTTRATHALRPWKLRVNLSALSQISPDGPQNLTKSERGGGATLYIRVRIRRGSAGNRSMDPVYAVESSLQRSVALVRRALPKMARPKLVNGVNHPTDEQVSTHLTYSSRL
jgi:hypothetical protein